METAEIRELTSAFVPEEILRDFELKEVEKEGGVYRPYMDEKDDESHYPPELTEAKEVARCGYMNPCEIRTFPTAFPCISTGVYRFPKAEADRIALLSIFAFIRENTESTKIGCA